MYNGIYIYICIMKCIHTYKYIYIYIYIYILFRLNKYVFKIKMPPKKNRKEDHDWKSHCTSKKPAKEDKQCKMHNTLYRLERSPIFAAIVLILDKDTRNS